MSLPSSPNTRKEMYLSNMAGQGTALPSEPHTREEEYLDYIAKNGGGGGGTGDGDMKKSVYDGDLDVAGAGGIKSYVTGAISGKVDKVQGKGLSTNDYDDSAKAIVDGVTTALDEKQPKTLSEPIYVDGIAKFSVETAIDAVNDLAASNKSALLTKADTSQIAAIQNGQNIDSFAGVETALADKVDKSTYGGVLGSDGNVISLDENISLFLSAETGKINLRTETTEVIQDGSIGIPTSRAVAGEINKVKNNINANTKLIKDTVGWSGKNKLNFPAWKGVGISDATVTWDDDTYTLTLTSTDTAGRTNITVPTDAQIDVVPNEKIKFVWDSTGTSADGIMTFDVFKVGDTSATIASAGVRDNELIMTVPANCYKLTYRVLSGSANKTLKIANVMCMDADILDTSFEHYFGSTAFPRSEQAVLGVKNLNFTTYKSETKGGVTWTANADNSVSISGRTSASETEVIPKFFIAPFTGQVKFCGGISNECHIYPWSFTDNARPYTDSTKTARQTGISKAIDNTLPIYIEEGKRYALILRIVGNNLDVSGTFYPLLVLDSETDLSYVAPATTNRNLARYIGHSSAYNDNVTKITITEDIGTIGVDSVLLLFIRHYTSSTTFIIREAYVNFYMDGTLKSGITMLHNDNSLPTITKVEQTSAGLEITFSAAVYATATALRLS